MTYAAMTACTALYEERAVTDVHELLDPDKLLERYGERIYRLAYRMMGNDADAEDVAQNTLIKVLVKGDSYRGESDPMGWIYRIVINESRELYRKRKRKPAVSLDALPIEYDDMHARGVSDFTRRPDHDAMSSEVDKRVREAIQELPDGYREAVVLMDLEGMNYKDAAEVLGLTLGGFKTRLHRGRLHLRNRLEAFWKSVDEDAVSQGGSK